MESKNDNHVSVLVIGGGWTGTQAAIRLEAAGVNVALLEAGPKLGGRVKTFGYTPGNAGSQRFFFEHGAQYVGDAQTEIMALINQYLPEALVDGYTARLPYRNQVAVLDGVRFEYNRDNCLFGIGGVPPNLDLWSVLGALLLVLEIQSVERQIDVASPWRSPTHITALDSITMAEWLARPWIPAMSRSLVAMSVQALLSVETHELSALYFHWYCACNLGFLNEVNDEEGGPQQYYMATGMEALIDRTVAHMRHRIHFDSPVQSIRQADEQGNPLIDADGKPFVRVTLQDGRVWTADKVLVAMSPKTYGRLNYAPELPEKRRELASQPMGRTIKCVVFYRTPWWRNSHGLHYTGYAGAEGNPILWVMDYSPVIPEGQSSCYALMTFTVGRHVDELGPYPSKEKLVDVLTKNLSFLFNDTRALADSGEFIDLIPYSWDPAQTYVGGGPNTVMGVGMLSGPDCAGRLLNRPWNHVYFASAETSRKVGAGRVGGYSEARQSLGYMDGAIVAGRFVADQILAALNRTVSDAELDDTPEETSLPEEKAPTIKMPIEPPPLSVDQVQEVLANFCTLLYNGSSLNFEQWEQERWFQDSQALLYWVADQLATALIQAGLLTPPPQNPSPPERAMEFMQAATSFIGSGNAYYNAKNPSGDAGLEDIRQMTAIGNALMQLKSSEPFPTPTLTKDVSAGKQLSHLIAGRFASMLRSFSSKP